MIATQCTGRYIAVDEFASRLATLLSSLSSAPTPPAPRSRPVGRRACSTRVDGWPTYTLAGICTENIAATIMHYTFTPLNYPNELVSRGVASEKVYLYTLDNTK